MARDVLSKMPETGGEFAFIEHAVDEYPLAEFFGLSPQELDEIFRSKNLRIHMNDWAQDGSAMDRILAGLAWWGLLARGLMGGMKAIEEWPGRYNSDLRATGDHLRELRSRVLQVVAIADGFDRVYTNELPDPVIIQALRLYREYTLAVYRFAEQQHLPRHVLDRLAKIG